MAAISIGFNPVFDNAEKTIEVYIIHEFGDQEFYGEKLEIDIIEFVRAEALYSDFDSLIIAI